MKNLKCFTLLFILFLTYSCENTNSYSKFEVANISELNKAIAQAAPGSEIILKNGIWKNVQIKFYGQGTENNPIKLLAATPGKVFIEGESFLHLGGSYLIVNGLYFRNGFSPSQGVIRYKIGKDTIAFNTQVTNCVIEDYSQLNRWEKDCWIEFYGKHNRLDHCYISGKTNDGATVMVYHKGNKHTNNHHQIIHNHFGPRPRKGGPRAETIRLGDSSTSMTPGRVNVSDNFFEACNGEVEIISDKTNYNSFTKNIFYKCEGSLVMRHSNYTTVNGNIFIGADDSNFYGGIRVVNTGHWITNNYFYKINGAQFRSPLALMNGIPKSPLNRYQQVTDVVVAHNTWIDCASPWQIGVGQNKASADVLPRSEIRSAPPIRCTVANNLIYNTNEDKSPIINHDNIEGVDFYNNIIDNDNNIYTEYDALRHEKLNLEKINDWLFVPAKNQSDLLDTIYEGFEFDKIEQDLFGASRSTVNKIGAISKYVTVSSFALDKKKYGPAWFMGNKTPNNAQVHPVTSLKGQLQKNIAQANTGDIIELTDKKYIIDRSIKIDKEIIIRAKHKNNVKLVFEGNDYAAAFEMNPKGSLKLQNISLIGNTKQMAFAPLNKNMSASYKISLDSCKISNFLYILRASRGSFADSINIRNTIIQHCENGFVLAADQKGDYNAEMVTFENCIFNNIHKNVIHYFRGGYDESTIGGFLTLSQNEFSACGKKEESGVLIKTKGIVNVLINDNVFQNNPIEWVVLLWGAKNNHHNNNTINQSGMIKVEEQQKLDLLY